MTDQVTLSISQFVDAWRLIGRAIPGSTIEAGDGVAYIFTGLPIPFFNVALPTLGPLSAAALEASARSAIHRAARVRDTPPWLFIVTHEALEPGVDPATVLEGSGLVPLLPLTGMVARRVAPADGVPAGLRLEVPEDDSGCGDIIDVNSAAYAMDLAAAKPSLGRGAFWADHVPVLGRAAGDPATSAAVLLSGGHRYVLLVATQPTHQKKGFAEAAMRHALSVSAERFGERPTFLHATDAGRPIYARMGYDPVATHTCFIDKQLLEGHTN
jgi:hypothetical protein